LYEQNMTIEYKFEYVYTASMAIYTARTVCNYRWRGDSRDFFMSREKRGINSVDETYGYYVK